MLFTCMTKEAVLTGLIDSRGETLPDYLMKSRSLAVLVLLLSVVFAATALAQQDEHVIPDDPAGMDPDQVIAQVGDVEITQAEFRARYRYERTRYFRAFDGLIAEQGAESLNLDDPQNQLAPVLRNVLEFLVDEREFGRPVYRTMILELLYNQEAQARGIELDECDVLQIWLSTVNIQAPLGEDCEPPEGFEEARAEYIEAAIRYSGMTEAALELAVISQSQFSAVLDSFVDDVELEDVTTVRTRHIRVEDEDIAAEVLAELEAGEPFEQVLLAYTADGLVEEGAGNLGYIQRGQMMPEFEDAAFAAEAGEIVGPVETMIGQHIIEVLDQQMEIRARHILFDNEDDANTALRLLNDGADFAELAREFSQDAGSGARGGDLGFFGPGQTVPEFEQAAFDAEIGEIVGPVESQFGFHIIEVTEISEEPVAINVRQIMTENEADALAVLERLEAGESFSALAIELSVDPSVALYRGDTLALLSGGQRQGFYARGESLPAFDDNAFDAEPGDLIGPLLTQIGYVVFEVQEYGQRPPSAQQIDMAIDQYANDWQLEQLESDRVTDTVLWELFIPNDPLPSDWSDELAVLDGYMEEIALVLAERRAATTIPNILRGLQVPDLMDMPELDE